MKYPSKLPGDRYKVASKLYQINIGTLTNCSIVSAIIPIYIMDVCTLEVASNTGYGLDEECFTIINADCEYADGHLTISNPKGNVTINATAKVAYKVTATCTNCQKISGPSYITTGYSGSYVFEPDTGYEVSNDNITISGSYSSISYAADGTLIINRPTSDITITATAQTEVNYLCFTAVKPNSMFELMAVYGAPSISLRYSTNKKVWQYFSSSAYYDLPNIGDKIYIKGTNKQIGKSENGFYTFQLIDSENESIEVSGDVTTLLSPTGNVLDLSTYGTYTFYHLFAGHTSYIPFLITSKLILPSTTLQTNCYAGMFMRCSGLISAPELPATQLVTSCYAQMFQDCSSLTVAPTLPATQLVTTCYYRMFYGCTNLNALSVSFTSWTNGTTSDMGTKEWVSGVTSTAGVFTAPTELPIRYGLNTIPSSWKTPTSNYFCLTANTANSSVVGYDDNWTKSIIYYSFDKIEWSQFDVRGTTRVVLENVGDKIYFKGNNASLGSYSEKTYRGFNFHMQGSFSASGDVTTLLDENGNVTDLESDYTFCHLFKDCTSLTVAPEIPSIVLSKYCYYEMFLGCTNLISTPTIKAERLNEYCCYKMFADCTLLSNVTVPAVTQLAVWCYSYMFSGCTSLTQAPELPATQLAERCYNSMFYKCTNLITAPKLPATTTQKYCYSNMFQGCTNLVSLPLLQTTLSDGCYAYMFEGCSKIKISETQEGEYVNEYSFSTSLSFTYAMFMFLNTGGPVNNTPTAQTYYTSNTIIS